MCQVTHLNHPDRELSFEHCGVLTINRIKLNVLFGCSVVTEQPGIILAVYPRYWLVGFRVSGRLSMNWTDHVAGLHCIPDTATPRLVSEVPPIFSVGQMFNMHCESCGLLTIHFDLWSGLKMLNMFLMQRPLHFIHECILPDVSRNHELMWCHLLNLCHC